MTVLYNRWALRERRKHLRKNQTEPEPMLWTKLRRRQLLGTKFRRQYSVGAYVINFYCPSVKLAIEIDGWSHACERSIEYDPERQAAIEACGIEFLRFTNEQVMKELDTIVEEIMKVIERRQRR